MIGSDLGSSVLKAVSRSFYLSVRILPAGVREPVGLAYLLARASDTVADSAGIPWDVRVGHLAALNQMVQIGDAAGLTELQRDIHPEHPGERVLIQRLVDCLEWLGTVSNQDRDEIRTVLARIIRGQTLDLERFSGDRAQIQALPDDAALEEYTYLVAGCVGEFWTRICALHVPRYSSLDPAELVRIGVDFGKGLQLVNILRDLPEDLRNGRCYLPADQLTAAGLSPQDLLLRPREVREIFTQWLGRSAALLDGGRQYVAAIRPARVRVACYLPWYIGRETLALLQVHPPLERSERVKVPRSTVRAALLRAPVAAWTNLPVRPSASYFDRK